MTSVRRERMSVDELVPWARREAERWELLDGVPMAMSPLLPTRAGPPA